MGIAALEKILVLATVFIAAVACSDISIDGYAPRNPEEAGIIDILKQYRNSRNAYELERYFACLHPKGKFSFMGTHVLSKQSLEKRLPGFWHRLKSKDASVYPIMRESITGDFFRVWAFYNPRISIDGATAEATLICRSSWVCEQRHYLALKKENGRWMIFENRICRGPKIRVNTEKRKRQVDDFRNRVEPFLNRTVFLEFLWKSHL